MSASPSSIRRWFTVKPPFELLYSDMLAIWRLVCGSVPEHWLALLTKMLVDPLRLFRRRASKMPSEIAAELGRADIADRRSYVCNGPALAGDHKSRLMEPHRLYILHRT